MECGYLDQQEPDHPADDHLQGEVDVLGQHTLGHRHLVELGQLGVRLGREVDSHAGEHPRGLVIGDRVLEGDVPGHEPHAIVPGEVAEAGLVTSVGLEQPVVDVGDGRAGDILFEAPRGVGHGEVPEHAPESLDRPDPGEGTDGRAR